jgi:hypothetical protein
MALFAHLGPLSLLLLSLALSLYLRVLPSPNYIDRRGLCITYINKAIVWVRWDGYQQICLWVSRQLLYKYMAKWLS